MSQKIEIQYDPKDEFRAMSITTTKGETFPAFTEAFILANDTVALRKMTEAFKNKFLKSGHILGNLYKNAVREKKIREVKAEIVRQQDLKRANAIRNAEEIIIVKNQEQSGDVNDVSRRQIATGLNDITLVNSLTDVLGLTNTKALIGLSKSAGGQYLRQNPAGIVGTQQITDVTSSGRRLSGNASDNAQLVYEAAKNKGFGERQALIFKRDVLSNPTEYTGIMTMIENAPFGGGRRRQVLQG